MRATKICPVCGRSFAWRRRWESQWERIRYCGERCRRRKGGHGRAWERAILHLVRSRPPGTSICPSEVARQQRPESWREFMEDVRSAARRLVRRGQLVVLQGGRRVDPDEARGPIRLSLP